MLFIILHWSPVTLKPRAIDQAAVFDPLGVRARWLSAVKHLSQRQQESIVFQPGVKLLLKYYV